MSMLDHAEPPFAVDNHFLEEELRKLWRLNPQITSRKNLSLKGCYNCIALGNMIVEEVRNKIGGNKRQKKDYKKKGSCMQVVDYS